jgi:prepilin-type N-terminal cleavage/methylation domain-containing protein
MQKKIIKAFSLIEIAVVLMIIGILVAGISQSKKLIAQTRINTARANTLSSPILSTQGLIFWLETVLEKSFLESEQEDLAPISKWLDLNTSQTIKFD